MRTDSYSQALIEYLSDFTTEERLKTLEGVLEKRTKYLTVVLEDIYQPHNASAVLRSCDCFGIQDVHIIEKRNEYLINPDVTVGSNRWLDFHIHSEASFNTIHAIRHLKKEGYRIIATTPEADRGSLDDIDIAAGKSALLFGTELTGLTKEAMDMADEFISIPMCGFTESFNISVSASIILYELRRALDCSDVDWKLTPEEAISLKLKWLKSSIKKSNLLEKHFKKTFNFKI